MSVKVDIFGKEINRIIYSWLCIFEKNLKNSFFAQIVHPLNKLFLSKIAKNWYTPCSDVNLATYFPPQNAIILTIFEFLGKKCHLKKNIGPNLKKIKNRSLDVCFCGTSDLVYNSVTPLEPD